MAFQPARLFRRTGRNSFTVQLSESPGVVEIYCTDVDWDCHPDQDGLEIRLSRLGSQAMFEKAATPICEHEGLQIELGPYDPGLRAFVKCRLRIMQGLGQEDRGCAGEGQDAPVEEPAIPVCDDTHVKRRVFPWAFF